MNEDQDEPGFEIVDRARAPDFMSFSVEQTGSNQGTQGLQGIQATAPAYADNDAGRREYADASQDGVGRQKDIDIPNFPDVMKEYETRKDPANIATNLPEQTLMRIRGVPAGHQSAQGFQSVERTADFSSKRGFINQGFALSDNGQHDHSPLSRDSIRNTSIPRQQNVQNKSKLNQGAYQGDLQPRTFEFQEQIPEQESHPSYGQLQQEQRRPGQADDWQSSSPLHGELQPHFPAVKYQSLHHARQPQPKQHSSSHLITTHLDGFQVAPSMSEVADKEAILRFRQQMMSKSPDGMEHHRGQKSFQPSAQEFQYNVKSYHSPQKRPTEHDELFGEQFQEYLAQEHVRLATLPSQGKQTKGTGRKSDAKKKKRGFFAGLKEKVFRTNRKQKLNGQGSEALATGRSSSVDSPGPAERLYEEAAIEQLMHSRSPGSFKVAPMGAASEDPAYGNIRREGHIRTRSGLVGVGGAGEFGGDLTAGMPLQSAQISITTPQTPQLGRKKPAAGRQMAQEFQASSLHNQSHDFRRMEPQFSMDSPMAALKASNMSKSSINSKFSSTAPGQSKKLKQKQKQDFQKKLAELTNHNRKFVASQFQKTGAGDPCESLQRAVMLQNAKSYQNRAMAAGSPEGREIEGNSPQFKSPDAGFGAESQGAAPSTPRSLQSMPMQSVSLFGLSQSPSEAHEQRLNQPGGVHDHQNQSENGIREQTFGGAPQPQMAKQGALQSQASANEQGLRKSPQQAPASAEPSGHQQAMIEASVHDFPEMMSNYQYDAQSSALGDVTTAGSAGYSGTHQGQEFALPSQDHIDLHKYFKMNRYFVSDEDKIYLESYVIKGIPKQLRRKYWLTVSGAYGYLKHYGEGYYKTLSTDDDEGAYPSWPHPDYQVIQKDIQRTFSDEAFFKLQENQDKIRRVLRAFVRRNPVQGYIQSMNYIVGRLVMVLQEEEAFWVFTLIMEKYLPIDYMLDGLTGAMTDQKVFEHIVNYKYPMILEKLNELKVQGYEEMTSRSIFQTIVVSWFQSLFTYNTPCELSLAIMDLFLLNGNNTIFFIGLALVSSIKKQIMSCKSIEQLQGKILKSTKNPVFTRTKQILLKSQKYKVISPYEIFKFREYYQKETSNEISQAVNRAIIQEKNGTRKNTDTLKVRKQQFLKEFPNFAISRKGEKRIPLVMQSHSDPVKFFTCNQKWQICSFDFTFRKVISDTITFRVKKFNVVQDYFYGVNEPKESLRTRQKKTISKYEDLIVFRGHHICDSQTFMNYLPKLFTNSDEAECDKLLNMDVLKIKKLKHPERQLRFLERFKEQIRRLANRDYNQRIKNKTFKKDELTDEQSKTVSKKPKREEDQQQQERISSGQANLKHSPTSTNNSKSQAEKGAKNKEPGSQIGLGQADKNQSSQNSADVHEGPNQRASRVSDLDKGLTDGSKSGAQTSRTEKKPNQLLATKELPKLQHLAAYDFDNNYNTMTKNGKMLMSFKPGVTNQNPTTASQNSYFLGQSSDIRESLMSQRDTSGSRAQVRRGTNNTRSFQNLKASFQSSRSNSNTRKDTGDFKMGDANMYVDVDFDDMYELEEVFYQIKFEMPRFREVHHEEEQKQEDQDQINSRSTPSKTHSSFEPFKIIMSKTDLDQMLLRGQSKSIFKLAEGNGVNEIALGAEQYEQQLQEVAAQNYLGIKLIDRETVGDEIYEALQLESLYARELGTKQMMKERDFDIILNLCKQRQEFQRCLVELQKQDAAALVGGAEGEEALSFENSVEENLSDDEDPGLMESALSGLSNFHLNADADNKDPAQARMTFTHETQGILLPKDASSTTRHDKRGEKGRLTQFKSGSPSKKQLFKRYSVTKTEKNSIDELEKQFLIFESQVLADLQYAQLAQRKE